MSVGRIGRRFIRWWTALRVVGVALLILAFLVGALGYLNERGLLYLTDTAQQILTYLSANVSTELASIAITILFVDALYEHRETEREKKRLILQMGSPDNAFAREAVRALRSRGWLGDGSLKKADLYRANLKEAHLWGANLEEAKLTGANLQKARLTGADLQGAQLKVAKLQETTLWATNLQGANLEDADLREANLRGSKLQGANLWRAKLQGAKLMEAIYSNATTWPEEFTPPALAINVDASGDVQ